MGETTVADHSLSDLTINNDERRIIYSHSPPSLFKNWRSIEVAWFQKLRFTGSYRMELELTNWDIIRLFKSAFGDELTPETITKYGFKVSPELEKAALGKVKIANLTVGELVAMIQPASQAVPAKDD
jgi:hypothetical protein